MSYKTKWLTLRSLVIWSLMIAAAWSPLWCPEPFNTGLWIFLWVMVILQLISAISFAGSGDDGRKAALMKNGILNKPSEWFVWIARFAVFMGAASLGGEWLAVLFAAGAFFMAGAYEVTKKDIVA